ncbi:MAG TPA: UvrD-helicase domain-containing protein [Clostridia bacterium]|nr:UvrD-helicase domain-containing protein [Clostridia bacterium]
MADNWTPEQLDAIKQRDCDLLVAAAAGAGKTAVLVERIIRKITDKDRPIDIDRLLVVTFTNAAATEMRERIGSALADALDAEPSDANLQKQMTLLDRASIMTLHSFCLETVKSHFHSLDLDPLFRIADETESALIRLDALEELFEEKYENEEPGSMFYKLVDAYGGGRDDSGLREMVATLHRFTRSHPWPEQWLAAQAEAYGPGASACLSSTPWARVLLKSAAAELQGLSALLRKAASLASRAQGLEPYCGVLEADIGQLEQLQQICKDPGADWDAVSAAFSAYEPERLPRCGKDADKAVQEEVKSARTLVKERVRKLCESGFNTTSAALEEDFVKLYPQLKYLADMVNEFEALYAQKKRLKNLLDFNDLEHLCLKVLIEDGAPTAAAGELGERYEEILVDEYQDSNLIQELILTTVAGNDEDHRSIFMVGDVKQSIYRFRQARPELFLSKYESYPKEPGHSSRTIQLYKNFRSRPEVVNGVNFVFRQIMSTLVGELDYTEAEFLNPGAVYEEPADNCITGGPVELHILDVTSDESEIALESGQDNEGLPVDDTAPEGVGNGSNNTANSSENSENGIEEEEEESLDNIQAEARIVGARIRKLVKGSSEGFNVFDKKLKGYRPAEYRDIVILMRATRNWADVFTDELAALGIPAYADAGLGYFRTVEVETVLSLLQIIDNPLQDIPMLAVLRSPIGGFDTDELADIRLADRAVSIYEAMKLFAPRGQAADAIQNIDPAAAPYQDQNLAAYAAQTPAYNTASNPASNQANNSAHNTVSIPASTAAPTPATNSVPNLALVWKTSNFLNRLENWRDASQYTPTDELVWKLMTETGYYSYVGILPGGAERQANLRMLFERARQYEETSYKGLFNFINFINKLRSGGGDMGSAKILGENDNVVRIMSIHKSKGLEFPIVIVAGCGKRFNMMDLNERILLHQELGFGPDLVDTDRRTIMPTLPKYAIRQKLRLETLSEEMRILYVAFTRAREKLIITGCVRDVQKTCAKWCAGAASADLKLAPFDMMQAMNYLDWIGPALARHGSAALLAKAAGQDGKVPIISDEPSKWAIKLWGTGAVAIKKEVAQAGDKVRKWLDGAAQGNIRPYGAFSDASAGTSSGVFSDASAGTSSCASSGTSSSSSSDASFGASSGTGDIFKALEWQYPFGRLSSIPAKISVTELKRRFSQEEETGAAASVQQLVAKPLFMETEQGISAARKGTLMHFVMQHLDLDKLRKAGDNRNTDRKGDAFTDEIKAQLDIMTAKELLTEEEAKVIRPRAIASFFGTSVGARMLTNQGVHRETAFNIAIGCSEVYKDLPQDIAEGETMLLQGVIDCWFETDDGILLLDYKTDFVPEGGSNMIKERYRVQMDYYTLALERVTGKKVAERYLYLFYNGELIDISPAIWLK